MPPVNIVLVETIDLYTAIAEMRRITSKDGTFSIVHATYNRDTGQCEGQRFVCKAHLRPQAKADQVINADYKLFYYDVDEHKPRVCWQMLIMYFNGMKVALN